MSDDRLRELERVWRASGSDQDEAAWLLAKVRAGRLTMRQLIGASLLDHTAAKLALEGLGKGDEPPGVMHDVQPFTLQRDRDVRYERLPAARAMAYPIIVDMDVRLGNRAHRVVRTVREADGDDQTREVVLNSCPRTASSWVERLAQVAAHVGWADRTPRQPPARDAGVATDPVGTPHVGLPAAPLRARPRRPRADEDPGRRRGRALGRH